MELEGSLKAFSLPEILQFLSMSKMTGKLQITKADNAIELSIRNGRIINSSTFARENKIGQMLVYRGVIQRGELEEMLALQKSQQQHRRKIGELLLESGLLTEEALKQTIKLQLEEEIWNLFETEEGDFKFEHGDPDELEEVLVEVDIEPLIIEGTRRLDEWARITQNIDSDELVPVVCELPENWERDVTLIENEWKILSMVNGFYTVGSLVRRSCLGKFETYRILNSLLNAGILQIKPAQDVPLSPAGSPRGKSAADDSRPDRPPTAKSFSAWFSKKKPPEPAAEADRGDCVSMLGVVCKLINRFMDYAASQKDFDADDRRLVQEIWRECLNLFPKVDLVCARGNRIYADKLERYIRHCGDSPIVKPIHEDGLEAVRLLLNRLFMQVAQRIGERSALRMLESARGEIEAAYDGKPNLLNGVTIQALVHSSISSREEN